MRRIGPTRRLAFSVVGVLAAAAIAIGINMFADARFSEIRADMTRGKIYTLSNGTRQVLGALKEPVTLRFFYSRRLGATIPVYGTYADHIQEMLREYAAVSNGRVKVEFYDPEPFSDTEDRAVAYGLQGVPVDNGGNQVYFGLAANNLEDDERTIPFFQAERERFLEFDLTKLIYELSNPKRTAVGVMSSLPLDGDPRSMMMSQGRGPGGQPYASSILLRQTNQVKSIPLDAQVIDADIQVLLVASARELPEPTLYAIDQFVMRGGKLMAMVDPWSEALAATPSPTGMPPTDTSSDLKKLFDAWGIAFDATQVTGDLTGAWRVRAGGDDRMQAVNYVAWFNIRDGINHDDPATADLTQVTVASAGSISKAPNADVEFTPLLSSSARSGNIPRDKLATPEPAKILANFKPEGGPRVIAARVRGTLKSAFTGPPELATDKKRPDNFPAHKAQTDGPANMVVVADSDILADRYWVRVADFFGQPTATPFADNGPFVANLIGTLAGGDALIGLRSRGDTNRPFERVAAMQSNAEARYRQTEQSLRAHLEDVEKQLRGLRTGGGEESAEGRKTEAVITPEQRLAIDAARKDIVDTRKKLRDVQLELNREISALDTVLRVVNIVLVPTALTILAIALALVQRTRRARARASA
ncbi:MAG: ABC transporter [Acetobacteraceae bacterium]|nr:ABC transporter [Acetobacteraceae bacterium]